MSETVSGYDLITEGIVKRMEAGVIPWRPRWKGAEPPKNLKSKEEYKGINAMLLLSQKNDCPYWLTEPEAEELGGKIRDNASPVPVMVGDAHALPFVLFVFGVVDAEFVFNASDVDGVAQHIPKETYKCAEDFSLAEKIWDEMPNRPQLVFEQDILPVYHAPSDTINLFAKERFFCEDAYYCTLFHEGVHSTGHPKRLGRFVEETTLTPQIVTQVMNIRRDVVYGKRPRHEIINAMMELEGTLSRDQSREELIAEFGAAYLCAEAKIDVTTIDDSARYIDFWLKKAQSDRALLLSAAADAQKAANYILNRKIDEGTVKRPESPARRVTERSGNASATRKG